MDMLNRLDELSDIIESAKSLPLSASCVVPRDEVLDLLDEIRATLPDTIREAEQIVRRRTEILDAAERGSHERVAEAEARAERITQEASDRANSARSQASAEAEKMLAEARMQAALIVDSHATTVAARDEAVGLVKDAQHRAELILASTTHRSNVLLAKAEAALLSAVQEVQREHGDLESMAVAFHAEIAEGHPDQIVDVAASEKRNSQGHGAEEFYDFELDVSVDPDQLPCYR
jgi:cell division septum initiation protein DivIVA